MKKNQAKQLTKYEKGQITLWKNLYLLYLLQNPLNACLGLKPSIIHAGSVFSCYSLPDQKTNLSFSSWSGPHSLARREVDEIMTPPPAIALHASKVHHKNCWANPKWSSLKWNRKPCVLNGGKWKRKRTGMRVMNVDGEEVKDGSCCVMMMTFSLLRQKNQHRLRAHIKRQPRPQGEESRGEWRSRSDGGGSHSDLDFSPLYSSDTKEQV